MELYSLLKITVGDPTVIFNVYQYFHQLSL